jgi:hypothetical protein
LLVSAGEQASHAAHQDSRLRQTLDFAASLDAADDAAAAVGKVGVGEFRGVSNELGPGLTAGEEVNASGVDDAELDFAGTRWPASATSLGNRR